MVDTHRYNIIIYIYILHYIYDKGHHLEFTLDCLDAAQTAPCRLQRFFGMGRMDQMHMVTQLEKLNGQKMILGTN